MIALIPAVILLGSWADRRLLLAGARIPLDDLASLDADAGRPALARPCPCRRRGGDRQPGRGRVPRPLRCRRRRARARRSGWPDGAVRRGARAGSGRHRAPGSDARSRAAAERCRHGAPERGAVRRLRRVRVQRVSKKLERVGVKSAAFVPVCRGFARRRRPRARDARQARLRDAGARRHAGLRLPGGPRARARGSSVALTDALERERLVSRISLEVRSRARSRRAARRHRRRDRGRDRRDAVLHPRGRDRLADGDRRGMGRPRHRTPRGSGPPPGRRTWRCESGRTVAVGDVEHAAELRDPDLGDVHVLLAQDVRAVLATPLLAGEQVLGVLGVQRSAPSAWSAATSRSRKQSRGKPRRRSRPRACCARASSGSPSRARC